MRYIPAMAPTLLLLLVLANAAGVACVKLFGISVSIALVNFQVCTAKGFNLLKCAYVHDC